MSDLSITAANVVKGANARIDRNGQTQPTETILIVADGTHEERVFDRLQGKIDRVASLLDLIVNLQEAA